MSADGNWKITIQSPMGAQEVEATITTSGDTFTGKTSGRMGDQTIEGKVDGDTLTWSSSISQPMPMTNQIVKNPLRTSPMGTQPIAADLPRPRPPESVNTGPPGYGDQCQR